MAINKNFIVRNGLEVDNNLIFADADSNKVGIGTTTLISSLTVDGDISATDATFSGIITASKFNGNIESNYANINNLNSTGISTFGQVESTSSNINELSATNLYVTGITTLANSVNIDNIDLTGSTITISGNIGESGQYLMSTGDGVAWSRSFSERDIVTIEATPNLTLIENLSYTLGFVDVYINGVKLSNSEFIANDGTTITLNQPCFGDETIEIISYFVSELISGSIISEYSKVAGISSELSPTSNVNTTGIITSIGGFTSKENTSPVKIEVDGNKLIFNVVGIGSTTLTLF